MCGLYPGVAGVGRPGVLGGLPLVGPHRPGTLQEADSARLSPITLSITVCRNRSVWDGEVTRSSSATDLTTGYGGFEHPIMLMRS